MSVTSKQTSYIIVGLLAGIIVGHFLYDPSWSAKLPESEHQHAVLLAFFNFFGMTIFMGLLKMLIIPLVASSVFSAVTSIGDDGNIVLDVTNESLASLNPNAQLIPLSAVGLIIGVDRILDMLRTAVNVWGEAVGAKIISMLEE